MKNEQAVQPRMGKAFLIKNTTKDEREQIVKDSLGCSDIGCDEGGAAFGYDFYQPYIDGEKELHELNGELKMSYISDGADMPYRGMSCMEGY